MQLPFRFLKSEGDGQVVFYALLQQGSSDSHLQLGVCTCHSSRKRRCVLTIGSSSSPALFLSMAQALAIGGWLASESISMLSDTIRSFISGRYKITTDQSSNFQSLLESLAKIKAVIGQVESKCLIEDPNVVSWLNHLKDVVYDAEDILDFINYHNIEASGNEGSSSVVTGAFKKATKTLKRTLFLDASLSDLSDVVNKFDRLLDNGQIRTLLDVIQINTESKKEDDDRRQTSSVLGEAKVFGRNTEMQELLDKVLVSSDENGSNGNNFSVVSIVGIGGVGKTTLAQWLYNHDGVKGHFNPKAWVCVSGKSNVGTIMMKIIESATRHPYNRTNFANIHEDLLRLLSKKRFLIVLDDVWDEIVTQWDKFISVFRHGEKGSKIVISTRDRIIAYKVSSMHTINLEGLGDEEHWEFFGSCAFGNVEPKDHPKLEYIGKQIASKLGGVPLAAKAVGGVLKLRLEERHWRDVLENKEWQRHGEILPSLRLSYNLLPAHLKQCFAYCALFPKDYVFSIDKLVHIWVAQGYVQSRYRTKTLEEDVGREYFNELYGRCFFQDYDTFDGSPLNKYVIHDLLHDLAESILADEVYREENSSSVENKIPKRVRHLFVKSSDLDRILDQIEEPKKLRSLVYDPPYTRRISQTSYPDFKKLRGLRVLILGKAYSPSYLPKTIGNMIHLRYMEFPLGTKLPISLGRLFNLQVLQLSSPRDIDDEYLCSYDPNRWFLSNFIAPEIDDYESMSHCFNDQTEIFEVFGKLTNLRYINSQRTSIAAIPSIGKLTSLQRLTHFEVRKQVCYKMCELRNLNKLHGCLRIVNLENVANKEEAKKAELHKKAHLEALSLWWNKSDHRSNDEIRLQEEVLEGLQPHSNIKGIGISRYMGVKHPIWFNKSDLCNIECISLFECGCLKALPPLWEFPFLKFLSLYHLMSLEIIGLEAHGGCDKVFPSLQHLKMHSLNELREWPGFKENVRDLMPLISTLEITNCNKLEALPPLGELPSLKHLHLSGLDLLKKIGIEVYGRGSIAFPSLQKLKLDNLKGLMKWSCFKEDVCDMMPLLSKLKIIGCPKLKALPPLGGLQCLEGLVLEELDSLKNIGTEMYGRESVVFPNLKKLSLGILNGLEEWWGLDDDRSLMPRLTELMLIVCPKLRVFPPLGELPSLEYLYFCQLDLLEKIGSEIYGIESTAFPSLAMFSLRDLRELTDWCAVEEQGQELMPWLVDMEVIDCPKLKQPIHDSFDCLDCLNVRIGFENEDDVQKFHEFPLVSSLRWLTSLTLGPLKGLEFFTAAQQEWLQCLTSLKSLSFDECSDLQRLPDVLESFHRLAVLTLIKCCSVVSLGQKSMPKNLYEFRLIGCGELEKLCDWRQEGTEWNKISHIRHIKIGKDWEDYEVIPQPHV